MKTEPPDDLTSVSIEQVAAIEVGPGAEPRLEPGTQSDPSRGPRP